MLNKVNQMQLSFLSKIMTKKMVENVKMPIITVHSNDIMNLFSNEFAI